MDEPLKQTPAREFNLNNLLMRPDNPLTMEQILAENWLLKVENEEIMAELGRLKTELIEATARAMRDGAWLNWVTQKHKQRPSPSMFEDYWITKAKTVLGVKDEH